MEDTAEIIRTICVVVVCIGIARIVFSLLNAVVGKSDSDL
jgi:hypothetical protein